MLKFRNIKHQQSNSEKTVTQNFTFYIKKDNFPTVFLKKYDFYNLRRAFDIKKSFTKFAPIYVTRYFNNFKKFLKFESKLLMQNYRFLGTMFIC